MPSSFVSVSDAIGSSIPDRYHPAPAIAAPLVSRTSPVNVPKVCPWRPQVSASAMRVAEQRSVWNGERMVFGLSLTRVRHHGPDMGTDPSVILQAEPMRRRILIQTCPTRRFSNPRSTNCAGCSKRYSETLNAEVGPSRKLPTEFARDEGQGRPTHVRCSPTNHEDYVSFHLMPVYGYPELLEGLTPRAA